MSGRQDAEETKEWDRFWDSGKVDDYLRYKGCHQAEGTKDYAGFYTGDGHCDKVRSGGGV